MLKLSFSEGPKVKPVATPGFAYLYYEDGKNVTVFT